VLETRSRSGLFAKRHTVLVVAVWGDVRHALPWACKIKGCWYRVSPTQSHHDGGRNSHGEVQRLCKSSGVGGRGEAGVL
jgi:hypothetical protein